MAWMKRQQKQTSKWKWKTKCGIVVFTIHWTVPLNESHTKQETRQKDKKPKKKKEKKKQDKDKNIKKSTLPGI
jgi:hypothetical protein